jgi:hypothetical protein
METSFTLTGRNADHLYTMQIEAAKRGWAAFTVSFTGARQATVFRAEVGSPGAYVVTSAAYARAR